MSLHANDDHIGLMNSAAAPAAAGSGEQPASRYHLTPEQVRQFDEQGFLVLRQRITGELLRRAQAAGQRWIDDGLAYRQANPPGGADDRRRLDYIFAPRPSGQVFFRVNYVHEKGDPVSLELLGSPMVLAVAESLCGRNFVPTYESMVFKMPGDGEAIPWHQDAVFPPRKFRVFNYDLYLDASRAGAGALHVIPKTQNQKQDICQIAERFGWHPPGATIVEMEPGDVLLHDDMVVHGSPRAQGSALRRTIYFEFRPAEQIREEGPFDELWMQKRLRLIPLALRRFAAAHPQAEQFRWKADAGVRPSALGDDDAAELRVVHTVGTPGTFCAASP